jgi:3-hydroxy-9,10-secoandrosta-1,3,5(10)-triene-9,17-dione monooxygenase
MNAQGVTPLRQAGPVTDLVEVARGFVPEIRQRARAMERAARLDDDLIEAMDQAGIFSAVVPKRFGGAGLGPREVHQIAEILGSADCSTAWVSAFYIFHNWLLCRYPMAVQEQIYKDTASARCAAVWAPPGQAERAPGGYKVTGKWGYASGMHHAIYALCPAIFEGALYWFIVPRAALEIGDDWDMGSMAATGSVTISTTNAFVPEGWGMEIDALVSPDRHGGVSHPESLYRQGFGALAGATASIGLGALDHALELAREKLKTSKPFGVARLDRSPSRIRWAVALQSARVARVIRDAGVAEVIAHGESGAPKTIEMEALNGLNSVAMTQLVKEALRSLMDGLGSSGYSANDYIRRSSGDVAMLATHVLGGDYDVVMDRHARWVLGMGLGAGDPGTRLSA